MIHDHRTRRRAPLTTPRAASVQLEPSRSQLELLIGSRRQQQHDTNHNCNDSNSSMLDGIAPPAQTVRPSTGTGGGCCHKNRTCPVSIFISSVATLIFTLLVTQNTSHGLQQQQQHQQSGVTNWTSHLFYTLPFGSSRHSYPRNAPPLNNNKNNHRQLLNSHYRYDIATTSDDKEQEQGQQQQHQVEVALREQLVEMRKKFELQLAASSGRRQVTLGSPCLANKDCSSSVEGAHCRVDSYTCACSSNHVQYNSTTCLPSALLGFKCSISSQCEQRVANSFCSSEKLSSSLDGSSTSVSLRPDSESRVCSCKSNFIPYRRDKCLQGSQINEYCLSNEQCRLADQHSYCQWRITNIYGTCKCPPNYKQLASTSSNNGGSYSSAQSQGKLQLKCVPRLGDACHSDDECQLATPNSSCQAWSSNGTATSLVTPDGSSVLGRARGSTKALSVWKSPPFSLSSQQRSCLCMPGYVVSANKLDCLAVADLQPSSWTTSTEQQANKVASNFISPTTATTPAASESSATNVDGLSQKPSSSPPVAMSQVTLVTDARGPQYDVVQPTTAPSSISLVTTTRIPEAKNESLATTTLGAKHAPPAGSTKTTTPLPTKQAAAQVTKTTTTTVSSLGKKCRSGDECRARDPHSACIGGICECLKPTGKCGANSTGCHRDTFQCRNGQCISWYFVCDQFKNCADGSDEDECQWSACPPEAFQCSSGQCLARAKLCNGRRDCSDGSDELHCAAGLSNSSHQHQGHRQHQHQGPTASVTHDDDADADWLSPGATHSNSSSRRCPAKAFTCSNGQCLPGYVFCNAVQDCSDGSDEREQLCERRHSSAIGPTTTAAAAAAAAATGQSSSGAGAQSHTKEGAKQQQEQAAVATAKGNQLDKQGAASSLVWAQENNNNTEMTTNTLATPTQGSGGSEQLATAAAAAPKPTTQLPLQLEDSPLVKADRLDINKMLASLKLPTSRQPAKRGRLNEQATETSRRRSRLLTESARRRQQKLNRDDQRRQAAECPRGSFTCSNGKCRSTAILCSGVDGCGDNSDEDRCEVCQCEAP